MLFICHLTVDIIVFWPGELFNYWGLANIVCTSELYFIFLNIFIISSLWTLLINISMKTKEMKRSSLFFNKKILWLHLTENFLFQQMNKRYLPGMVSSGDSWLWSRILRVSPVLITFLLRMMNCLVTSSSEESGKLDFLRGKFWNGSLVTICKLTSETQSLK